MARRDPSPSAVAQATAEVALVHDYLLVPRGAERTFAEIAGLWPGAPIYTLLYDAAEMGPRLAGHEVLASDLQRLHVHQAGFRRLLPLYPRAAERLPVAGHPLVVSSSSAFAHGVRPGPDAQHVVYCHSPFRYAWHERERGLAETPRMIRPLVRRTLDRIRQWDVEASKRVTYYIANSEITRGRIEEWYGRESVVVHPPVETQRFEPGQPHDYFMVISEIVPHKRIELALEAAALAGARIVVVGEGGQLPELRARYEGQSVQFLGRIDDDHLAEVYAHCRAIVVPNVEEFGIAAVEAQAAGRPVVGANVGGTSETVVDGVTGVLVEAGNVDSYAEAMRYTDFESFSTESIMANAARFSASNFRSRFALAVQALTGYVPDAVSSRPSAVA